MDNNNILQNLKDAGCNSLIIDKFFLFIDSGKTISALKLLDNHRKRLLNSLHENQKKIDCLDFLIFNLKSSGGKKFV